MEKVNPSGESSTQYGKMEKKIKKTGWHGGKDVLKAKVGAINQRR